MKSTSAYEVSRRLWVRAAVAWACLSASVLFGVQQSAETKTPASSAATAGARSFDTPQQAATALIAAAEKFDVRELIAIFGSGGDDIVLTGEYPQDRQRAADFVGEAHEKQSVSMDPKSRNRAFLIVGNEKLAVPGPDCEEGWQMVL